MPSAWLAATVTAGAGAVAFLGTRALIPLLSRTAVLDRPNERSLHAVPTPRGGGIAVILAILSAWLVAIAAGAVPQRLPAVVGGAAVLAAVSWFDDRRGLAPAPRLVAHIAAVAVGLLALRPTGQLVHDWLMPAGPVFQGWLPPALDIAGAALLWVWFVNLFNFMDGIDGLAGSEAAAIAAGLLLFATVGAGRDPGLAMLAAPIGAAAIGFLVWNWAPARIFLGDVGSVPLGYLLGFLLLFVAARGHWRIAVILPLYFLADATITLLRRLARRERVWQAHRQHFYQRAVRRGLTHAAVASRVIAANFVLIGSGWAAENGWGVAAVALAAAVVLALLASLAGSISLAKPRIKEPPF